MSVYDNEVTVKINGDRDMHVIVPVPLPRWWVEKS